FRACREARSWASKPRLRGAPTAAPSRAHDALRAMVAKAERLAVLVELLTVVTPTCLSIERRSAVSICALKDVRRALAHTAYGLGDRSISRTLTKVAPLRNPHR